MNELLIHDILMIERLKDMLEHMKNDYKAWADLGPDPHGHRTSMYEEFCNSLDYTIGKKYIKVLRREGDYHSSVCAFIEMVGSITPDMSDEEIMNLIDEIEAEESARIELADHAMNEV